MTVHHVIVGLGAAGFHAARAIRHYREKDRVTILSGEPRPFYRRVLTSYLVAGRVSEEHLHVDAKDFYQGDGLQVYLGETAVALDLKNGRVTTGRGEALPFDRLLLATGATPQGLPVPGENRPGVFCLRTLKDAQAIGQRLSPGMRALVVGGGMVGIKSAEALRHRGLDVTVVVSSPRVLSQALDEEAAALVERVLRAMGIRIITGEDVISWEGEGTLTGAGLRSGKSVPCDLAIVGKGVTPNVDLARAAGLETGRGIRVDARQRTSSPGVFAAGDCAETLDRVWGTPRVNALWTEAVAQGSVAGANMAGREIHYPGSVGVNSLTIGDFGVISGGMGNAPKGEFQVMTARGPWGYRKVVQKGDLLTGIIAAGPVNGVGCLVNRLGRSVSREQVEAFLEGRGTWHPGVSPLPR